MGMEEMQEFAGHLKAELMEARHLLNHGQMSSEEFLRRVNVLRKRREAVSQRPAHHTATIFSAQPQMPLL